MKLTNKFALAQMGGDPVAYVAHRKELLMRGGPGTNFFALVLLGMPLIALVEVVAYVIRGGWRPARGNSGSGPQSLR